MKRQNIAKQSLLAALVVLIWSASATLAAAQTEGILHSFAGGTADGAQAYAGPISDSAGNLYGTAAYEGPGGQGIVYQLKPPSGGGTWTENILWSFTGGSDGATPTSNLIMDSSGAIYGTTVFGGTYNCGTFFQLTAPVAGGTAWSENSLYQFPCFGSESATQDPTTIAQDPATGIFYGTLQAGGPHDGGSVYKLALSGGVWTYTTLHNFNDNSSDPGYANGCNPWSLLFGPDGNLYGTALYCGQGGGTVFRLSHPTGATGWGFNLLYSFGASSTSLNGAYPYGLLIGLSGVLYGGTAEGGTSGYGTIYSLTRPVAGTGGPWTEAIIHDFAEGSGDGIYPLSGVILGPAGSLYGTTAGGGLSNTTCGSYPGCGTVFQLIPGSGGMWTETILHNFAPTGGDAINPNPGPLLERGGNLYGATYSGGADSNGAVYAVHP